jgi:hypothetical protein
MLLDFSRPIPLLRALYPGSFPEIPLRPEARQERVPGALLTTEEAAEYLAIAPGNLAPPLPSEGHHLYPGNAKRIPFHPFRPRRIHRLPSQQAGFRGALDACLRADNVI